MHTCPRRYAGLGDLRASDAVQALEHWRLHAPDVVLLEPVLPRGDGLALCRHIRESSATPVLLVTTRGSDDEVHRGLAAGASDHILKPLSPRELIGFSLKYSSFQPSFAEETFCNARRNPSRQESIESRRGP